MIKPISLQDFLAEDISLTEKATYDYFQKSIRRNLDDGIGAAYKVYLNVIDKLNK